MKQISLKNASQSILNRIKSINKKKLVIGIILLVVILFIASRLFAPKGEGTQFSTIPQEDTYTITLDDFTNEVSTIATVESQIVTEIYSTQTLSVQAVYVSVGDTVQEGDLLLEYDASSIEESIESKELALEKTLASAQLSLESAQKTYDDAVYALENGLNSSMISATYSMNNALDSYNTAVSNYDSCNSELSTANSAVTSASAAVTEKTTAVSTTQATYDKAVAAENTAATELATAKATCDTANYDPTQEYTDTELTADQKAAKTVYDAAQGTYAAADTALTNAQTALAEAKNALATAQDAYDAAVATQSSLKTQLESLETAKDSAYSAYENTCFSYAATENTVRTQIETYANNITSAELSLNQEASEVEIDRLYDDLAATKVYATASGTMTSVQATEGTSANGLIFVIEDLTKLKATTSVEAYDINNLTLGMKTNITSNDLIDKSYTGTVSLMNKLTESSLTTTSSDASYTVEVNISNADDELLTGMQVTTSFVMAEEENVLCVPLDALYTNDAGETCVLTLTQEGDALLVGEAVVTTGLENDFEVIVTGTDDTIAEGSVIINYAEEYLDYLGMQVVYESSMISNMMMNRMSMFG